MQFTELTPHHNDLVHDIAFDYYGKRFASCSSDKHIKIWDLDSETKTWSSYDLPRAHQDSIWRLSWAHPEFGQILASCSEDRTVIIWEEQDSVSGNAHQDRGRWLKKSQLCESKRSVNDVKFSPRNFGLKLATASADGFVRIYEASDVFSLGYWPLQDSFQVTPLSASNQQPSENFSTTTTTTNSNINTSNPSTINNNTSTSTPSSSATTAIAAPSITSVEHGLTSLSWSDCPFESPKLVVGGYTCAASVWTQEGNKWIQECVLDSHMTPIHDVAWAPVMGRSYHLIATASREKYFKIHILRRFNESGLFYEPGSSQTIQTSSAIWRVAWNITGTVLVATSEDGTLSLWRKDFAGEWINVQDLPLLNGQSEPMKVVYTRSTMTF